MQSNRGKTTLKRSRRAYNPMREFDRLPPQLRRWVSQAALPWRAKTVLAAYEKALINTGCVDSAMAELNRLQQKLVAKDASKVWGCDHPDAA